MPLLTALRVLIPFSFRMAALHFRVSFRRVRVDSVLLKDPHYSILALPAVRVIPPGTDANFVRLRMLLNSSTVYNTQLVLKTNATTVYVSLPVYHLRLLASCAVYPAPFEPPRPEPGEFKNQGLVDGASLDFGPVAVGSPRRALLNISNPNPLNLRVVGIEMSASLDGLLRCSLQTVRDKELRVATTRGSAVLHSALPLLRSGKHRKVTELEREVVTSSSTESSEVLFSVPRSGGRAILACELDAMRTGSINGSLTLRLEKLRQTL